MRPVACPPPIALRSWWARREGAPLPTLRLLFIQVRQPLGFGDIIHGVGVEERIERLCRPCHGRELVARGPAVDLADVLLDQRVAKFLAQCDAPQSDHRMGLPRGSCDGELCAFRDPRLLKPRYKIARQKRTIRGGAQNPSDV